MNKIDSRIILIQKISFFEFPSKLLHVISHVLLLCTYLLTIHIVSFADDKSLEKIDDDSKSEPESLEEGEVR